MDISGICIFVVVIDIFIVTLVIVCGGPELFRQSAIRQANLSEHISWSVQLAEPTVNCLCTGWGPEPIPSGSA